MSKVIHTKPHNPLFTSALKKLKLAKRHLERIWSLMIVKTCKLGKISIYFIALLRLFYPRMAL